MTFATLTNIVLILLCGAVLVQSIRMMRSFEALKKGGLKDVVEALDKSTSQARIVLGDLKDTLRTEGAANARSVAKGEEMREELTVMVGIANAVAERIIETVESAPKTPQAEPPKADIVKPKHAKPEPAKPEPAKHKLAKVEAARNAPAKAEPVKIAVLPQPVAKISKPRTKSAVRGKRPFAARAVAPAAKRAAAAEAL